MRTFTDRHGLRDLCKDLLNVDLSKQQQSSDWGAATLTEEQLRYAASDVLHLHALRAKLDAMLAREGAPSWRAACFDFLPTRVLLDLGGLGGARHLRALSAAVSRRRRQTAWGCAFCGVHGDYGA